MGTTCTAAILENDRLVIAQVGDSRAYLLQSGRLTQITRDHSLMANMIDAGQITPEEARVHPNRSVITRALGNDPETVPDLYQINVKDGDRLLICSDGLTSMIEDDEIQAVMNRVSDPQACADLLVDGAIAAGGLDNITVIVVNIEFSGERALKKITARTRLTAVLLFLLLAGIIALTAWGTYFYLHNSVYLKADDAGMVAVYRGVPGSVMGFSYSELIESTDVPADSLVAEGARSQLQDGMPVGSVEEALKLIESYREDLARTASSSTPVPSTPSSTAEPGSAGGTSGSQGASGESGSGEGASGSQAGSTLQDSAQGSSSSGGQNR